MENLKREMYFMSKFKKICLGDYIMVKHGFAFSGEFFTMNPSKYVLTTPGNFKIGGGFQELKNKYYIGHVDEEYILNKNDIIVTMTDLSKSGDTLGYSSLVPANNKYLHNQRIGRICFKNDNINKMFLYWLLRTPHYHNYIVSTATGSTVRHTAPKTIQAYECYIPETKEEQQAIVDVLSSFDDKIELNNKIIRNLEEQVQSLYKNWFIDFEFPNEEGKPYKSSGGKFKDSELGLIPEKFNIKIIKDLSNCLLGGTPSRNNESYWNGNIPWINSGKVNEFRIVEPSEYITKEGLDKSSTKLLKEKTIVIAITGATLGQISILEIEACANQSVVGIENTKDLPYEYLYCTLLNRIEELLSNQTGGAQQHINKDNVENFKFIYNKNIVSTFQRLVTDYFDQQSSLIKENKKLEETRDFLLQKLMNGEIKVGN